MTPTDEIYSLFLHSPRIVTDSRQHVAQSIFIGLKGERFDGNRYAAEALQKGASLAVIDDPACMLPEGCILVGNTLKTLQELAIIHRSRMRAKIIGITGSNGKTTTKELTGKVLSAQFKTIVTQGNLNNHIGVPLTILAIQPDTEYAVVEMGANHPGEIAALCEIARPGFGIITNIGKAHLEGFGSPEGIVAAKSELYSFIRRHHGMLIVNKDDDLLMQLSQDCDKVTYGSSMDADCSGRITGNYPSLSLEWNWKNHHGAIETNLYGDYNFENIMAAVCTGLHFGVDPALIGRAVGEYLPENNRSQRMQTHYNTLLLDAYNANPTSMRAALLNFSRLPEADKTVILGDMMELGSQSHREHSEIIALLREMPFRLCLLIGEHYTHAAGDGPEMCFPDIAQAEKYLMDHPVRQMTILLKGSRAMQLEKLIPLL